MSLVSLAGPFGISLLDDLSDRVRLFAVFREGNPLDRGKLEGALVRTWLRWPVSAPRDRTVVPRGPGVTKLSDTCRYTIGHMTVLHSLAEELAVDERTLRRAIGRGLIRASRPSERRIEVPFAERRYVETHWALLGKLLARLRTRHKVRLVVLFGSVARGDDRATSDVDLLVSFAPEQFHSVATLAATLGEEIGRAVQVVSLETARRTPLLLADVLRDGRVLVDRDGEWEKLERTTARIHREARQAAAELDEQLAELAELVGAQA